MGQQVAIITGAGGGIGRATAIELSRLGFSTVLVGRTEQSLHETLQSLTNLSPSPGTPGEGRGEGLSGRSQEKPSPTPLPAYRERVSEVLVGDVTKLDDIDSVVKQILAKFGRIDAIVNNAGIAPVLSVEQTTPQIWHEVLETNLSSAFFLSRAVWPTFKKQHSGMIVNISSMAARDPFPGFAAYGAAKAGLVNLGLSLAKEGASIGVRVFTIAPGAVETPMLRKILSPEQFPSENTLAPQDVARVVGECVSGKTSRASGEVVWLAK